MLAPMPEDHRRVEPRSIVGTGMATQPDRIAHIEDEAARRERAWREAPEERFGDVLGRAPARGDMLDADVPDRRRRAQATEAPTSSTPLAAASATPAQPEPPRPTRLTPRAPDPREQQLRAVLAARQPPAPAKR
jgi:hypothetical protein